MALTMQQVGGGVGGAVGVYQLPIKVILLPLAVFTQAGIRVLVKGTPCSWRERGTANQRGTHTQRQPITLNDVLFSKRFYLKQITICGISRCRGI